MASLISHAVVGIALGQTGQAGWRKKTSFWLLCIICAMLPDIDVLGFHLGIHYNDLWGHRGLTHSLLGAFVVALCLGSLWCIQAWKDKCLFIFLLFLITVSHGLLDAFTNGGLGVAFFSPFDTHRYFFPWRPISVSPLGFRRFLTPRGIQVLKNEIFWIILPASSFISTVWLLRLFAKAKKPALKA